MAGSDALEALRSIPLFSHVADPDLEQIASHLIERRYPRNTTIVEEGLPGDYMYIIREGRVKVTKLSEDDARRSSRSSSPDTSLATWRCSTAHRAPLP